MAKMWNFFKKVLWLIFLAIMVPCIFIDATEPDAIQFWDRNAEDIVYEAMTNWNDKSANLIEVGSSMTKEDAIRIARNAALRRNEAVRGQQESKEKGRVTVPMAKQTDGEFDVYYHVKDGKKYICVVKRGFKVRNDGVYEAIQLKK